MNIEKAGKKYYKPTSTPQFVYLTGSAAYCFK
jgi:hypothetical protein